MNNFRMWLANFMRGRYGTDDLNKFLLVIAVVLIIIDIFVRSWFVDALTVLLLIYIYCRMFSRNINARYMENQRFLDLCRDSEEEGRRASAETSLTGYSDVPAAALS